MSNPKDQPTVNITRTDERQVMAGAPMIERDADVDPTDPQSPDIEAPDDDE